MILIEGMYHIFIVSQGNHFDVITHFMKIENTKRD